MSTFFILLVVYYATAYPTVLAACYFAMSEVYRREGGSTPWLAYVLYTAIPFIGAVIAFFRMVLDAAAHVFNLYVNHEDKEAE